MCSSPPFILITPTLLALMIMVGGKSSHALTLTLCFVHFHYVSKTEHGDKVYRKKKKGREDEIEMIDF